MQITHSAVLIRIVGLRHGGHQRFHRGVKYHLSFCIYLDVVMFLSIV
jgi:hypothetical protein